MVFRRRQEEPTDGCGKEQYAEEVWNDAANAFRIEVCKINPACSLQLSEKNPGDEVPRDDKKHIDPYKATREQSRPSVKDEDR